MTLFYSCRVLLASHHILSARYSRIRGFAAAVLPVCFWLCMSASGCRSSAAPSATKASIKGKVVAGKKGRSDMAKPRLPTNGVVAHAESQPTTRPTSGLTSGPTTRPTSGPTGVATPVPARVPELGLYRQDAARTGRTPFAIPRSRPRLLWRHRTGGPLYATPAVDKKGRIFVGSLDGNVYALAKDGALLWKKNLGGRIFSSAAIWRDGLLVGSDADRLFFLDRESGKPRWQYDLGPCQRIEGFGPEESRCDADSSPLVVSDNKIIFGGDAIYALGTGGKLRWKVPLLNHASSSAALAEDLTVYIGTQDHALMALDARGKVLWQFRTRYHFDATPVVSGSHVYAGCDDGRIYDIDRKTGQANWEVKTRGPIRASAAIGFDGTIYVGSYDGKLYAINGDGSIRWTYRSRGAIHSSPTVDRQGTVIFGSRDDSVYALDAEGKRLWRLRLGGDVDGSIAVAADGLIVVGADDGFLSVLQGP